MAVGEPFAFCGRIVEAYYSNAELDTVQIMWSDGEKDRVYHLKVDENDAQFQALISEYSYESLDESTRAKNEAGRQLFRDAFHRYATNNNLYGHGEGETPTPEENLGNLDLMFEFDPEDAEQKKHCSNLNSRYLNKKRSRKVERRRRTQILGKQKPLLKRLQPIILF